MKGRLRLAGMENYFRRIAATAHSLHLASAARSLGLQPRARPYRSFVSTTLPIALPDSRRR